MPCSARSDLRIVSVLAAAALWVVGCDEAVPNRAPEAVGEIPDVEAFVGETVEIALAEYFTDPDGDELSYSASSSDTDVATVAVSGYTLAVTGVAAGSAQITVTASDDSLSATQGFTATFRLTDRDVLAILYDETDGRSWTRSTNWLTDRPLDQWYGVYTDSGGRVTGINLVVNNLSGPIPPELGQLGNLESLFLIANSLLTGPIPPELGQLGNLRQLGLVGNDLTGPIPPELAQLRILQQLSLDGNDLSGPIPPELGEMGNLRGLTLSHNSLSGPIPLELVDLDSLESLWLGGNDLAGPIPPELGEMSNLIRELSLGSNSLSGPIPPELGELSSLQQLGLGGNDLTGPIPPELGELGSLEWLLLDNNELSGPVPPELGDLGSLERINLHNNADLEGRLPSSFSNLTSLEELLAHGTGLCVPSALWNWYRYIDNRRARLCDDPIAYLVQAVQSREDPVPVVAEKEALLRIFVVAARTTTETLPPATATFYVDDEETYSVEIDGTSEPIPTEIDEGSLDKSLNVTIPGSVIEEGLSVVIEIDPDSTIDAEILVARRIPESGELDLQVEGVPGFELTAIPFLYTEDPDSSVIETVEDIADDEEDHELLHDTYDLLPIEEMSVDDHDPVEIDSDSGFAVLRRTIAIRATEGGSGYWMGLMPRFSDVGGVARRPGTSSASVTEGYIMAHELGHNLSLWHAPCGNPGSVDPDYPYEDGSIGAWGYDHRGDSLIDKDDVNDLMTYCRPEWVSDYHFEKAHQYRTAQEMWHGGARRRTGPSLLVWGTRSASGELSMDPALLVEGRSLLPEARGDYTLTGLDAAQRELFSISFEMDELADAEEGTGIFVFLLPVEPGWEALASLVLAGPGDALVTIDGETEATMALIRDARSGQVRAIRGDFAERPPAPPGHVVRWSRGVPDRDAWRVMTGRRAGAGP
ncbi:MAG: M66 family metalloprotease [Gemmatimonadetes bacterium]|nr:M66 family metalloprotease [Gemmatimonadota bacterium]